MIRRARLRPFPGDEALPGRQLIPLADPLWPKVAGPWLSTLEHPITDDDCWDWTSPAKAGLYRGHGKRRHVAGPDRLNYGRLSCGRRGEGTVAAHVAAYEVTYGPVPAGLVVRHLCDRGVCCNPRHLAAGTMAENAADRRRRVRERSGIGGQPTPKEAA